MCEKRDSAAMARLAPPLIWKARLEREVRASWGSACRLVENAMEVRDDEATDGPVEVSDDEATCADTEADTEKPPDTPDNYVPSLLVLTDGGRYLAGGGCTPRRSGGGSGAASSSHSNPSPPDHPRGKWNFHFYTLGSPN